LLNAPNLTNSDAVFVLEDTAQNILEAVRASVPLNLASPLIQSIRVSGDASVDEAQAIFDEIKNLKTLFNIDNIKDLASEVAASNDQLLSKVTGVVQVTDKADAIEGAAIAAFNKDIVFDIKDDANALIENLQLTPIDASFDLDGSNEGVSVIEVDVKDS